MEPIAIDPSEVRLVPPAAPSRSARPKVVAAGAVVLGAACVLGAGLGTASLVSGFTDARRAEIQIGTFNWPEIRNGVPEIVSAVAPKPAEAARSDIPGPPIDPVTSGLLAGRVDPPVRKAAPTKPLSVVAVAVPATDSPAGPLSADRFAPASVAPAPAASPPPARQSREFTPSVVAVPASATPALAVPLPPAAPLRPAVVARRDPVPVAAAPVVLAGGRRPAAADVTGATAAPVPAAMPADPARRPEDDHVEVFGIAVPTLGATGRRIRETAEALGDAVGRIPTSF